MTKSLIIVEFRITYFHINMYGKNLKFKKITIFGFVNTVRNEEGRQMSC